VLLEQHQATRQLTDLILQFSAWPRYHWFENLQLAHWLHLYIRMYEPHEAREDTVLFPAFRELIGSKEFKELGERFEQIEDRVFGKNRFQ
jgi:hemerythrin-like domain-containing protein